MGRYSRKKPAKLAGKLLQIRKLLGLSQNEMIHYLGVEDEITQSRISGYELGTREPSLPLLLKYARAINISTDVLIDDNIDIPEIKLPLLRVTENLNENIDVFQESLKINDTD